MFARIVHASDGSEPAFKALALALSLARQNGSELQIVCVEEIDYLPEFIEDVREEAGAAARRFHGVLGRVRSMAEDARVPVRTHVVTGHAVRDILRLASDLGADLIVIGSTGHSTFYERMVGSTASRVVHLATCPVLVVK
jgi:nucleotide-binding universal stress UspA family protein